MRKNFKNPEKVLLMALNDLTIVWWNYCNKKMFYQSELAAYNNNESVVWEHLGGAIFSVS